MQRLENGERITHFETVRVVRSGKRIDVSLTIFPIFNRRSELIGASTIARDISGRKSMENRLLASKEHADRALTQMENIAEGILITNSKGDSLLANPGFWRCYGLEAGTLTRISHLEALSKC